MEINGREIAQSILEEVKQRVEKLKIEQQLSPHLAVVRVGDDPSVTSYVNQKQKTAEKIGIQVSVYHYPETVTEQELLQKLQLLDADKNIHGIILQLPIPKHLDQQKLLDTISPEKDVDGFHPKTQFPLPITAAIAEILQYIFSRSHIEQRETVDDWLKQQTIVVIGKGKTGGQPMIDFLQSKNLQPMIIDSATENPKEKIRSADIIIAAVGKQGIVTKEMVKPGAIILGIGMEKDVNGKFYGDYNVDEIKDIAGFYTPVPGGIGPVNVAKLMENVVLAAEKSLQ